jgi:predicted enzyme related to lactoylglutathione lyase
MPRVALFEIQAEKPERAIQFYRAALGWEFRKWAGPGAFWMISTGPQEEPGINGGLVPREEPLSGSGMRAFVCTVDVPSIDEYLSRAVKAGGQVEQPKTAIPGVGWIAYCKDTEGNTFGMRQLDPQARCQ